MKKQPYITQPLINLYSNFFTRKQYVNFFSQKKVYLSQNFISGTAKLSQLVGDLGGVPVNAWPDERNQTDIFIISEADYNQLHCESKCYLSVIKYSNEVNFISNLINNKQTIVDKKNSVLSSNILIVRECDFLNYVEKRKGGEIMDILKINDTKLLKSNAFEILF